MDAINLLEKFSLFSDQWSPKVIGAVNDMHVKLARMKGPFVWHTHENEDEMFLVVQGELTIHLRERDVTVCEGELFIVPHGAPHMPHAEREALVLLFEPAATRNTGSETNERTVETLEWI